MAPPKKTFQSSSNFATNRFADSPEDETSANSEGSGHWGSPQQPQRSGLTPPPRDSPPRSPNTPVKPPGTSSSPEPNTLPEGTATPGPSGTPAPRRTLSPTEPIEHMYLSNSDKSDENLEDEVFGVPPQSYSQAARCLDYGL